MSVEFGEAHIPLLLQGDPEAYRLLYKHFFIALCIFARNMGIGKEEAEDIVQEIFCHIYRENRLPHHPHAFKSYLYSAVRNRCLNLIRDTRRRKNNELIFSKDQEVTTFWEQIVENEVYRELQLSLDKLPEQCRKIFQRSLNGDTSEKIADELHLSIETVKTQRKKAKKILRERYRILQRLFGMLL